MYFVFDLAQLIHGLAHCLGCPHHGGGHVEGPLAAGDPPHDTMGV
jgi:hypothetical protein